MKPIASLSLDLDNKWSYLKTRGDPAWRELPSYLDVVIPRFLQILEQFQLSITVFVVGQDAAIAANHSLLRSIADAGHEIGNHSFHHEPWLHLYSPEKIEEEVSLAEEHINLATGHHPRGFRGPGYSLSPVLLETLSRRGYGYDASTLPTFLGPLARAYYFATARLTPEQKHERGRLFGSVQDGFRPIRPYLWDINGKHLLEIPVTTMPLFRTPIHLSYVLYISVFSHIAALAYLRSALALCKLQRVAPSFLLHPLDFLDAEDVPELSFFPAMKIPAARKLGIVRQVLQILAARYQVTTVAEHARQLGQRPDVLRRERKWN